MNSPTIVDELKRQLKHAKAEIGHLNAVNQELQDMLTAAKLEIKELKEAAEDAHYNMIEVFERME